MTLTVEATYENGQLKFKQPNGRLLQTFTTAKVHYFDHTKAAELNAWLEE